MRRDGAAFRAAILEDPADEATRRVLADGLDERGDPRGRWVRAAASVLAGPHFPTDSGPWPGWSRSPAGEEDPTHEKDSSDRP